MNMEEVLPQKNFEIAKLQQRLQLLKDSEKDLQDELTKYRSEVNKLNNQLEESTRTVKHLQQKVELLTHDNEQSICEPDVHNNEEYKQLEQKLRKEQRSIDRLENENFKFRMMCDDYEEEAIKSQNVIRNLERGQKELVQDYTSVMEEMQSLLEEANKKDQIIHELQKHCSELQEIMEVTRSQSHTVDRFSLSIRSPECFRRTSGSEDLGMSVVDVQLREAKDQVNKLQEANDSLSLQINSYISQQNALTEENTRLEMETLTLRRECEFMKVNHLEDMKKEMEKVARETKAELQKRYGSKFEEMKQNFKTIVTKDLSEKDLQIQSLKQSEDNLIRERATLRAGNVELNNMVYKLREQLTVSQEKYNKISVDYDNLKCQIALNEKNSANEWEKRKCELPRSTSTSSILSAVSTSSAGSVNSRLKVVPFGSGTLFTCDDEDDQFQFSEKNLAKLRATDSSEADPDRVQEIQRRNTLVPPHMRSCYPAEFQFFDSQVDEENIRVSRVFLPETFKRATTTTSQKRQHSNSKPFAELTNQQHKNGGIPKVLPRGKK